MAHLWQEDRRHGWRPVPLDSLFIALDSVAGAEPADDDATLVRTGPALCRGGPSGNQWSLLTPAGGLVRVNGQSVSLGMRVLQDRDEIVFGSADGEAVHAFFSTELLAEVAPFPGESPMICPRCKQGIKPLMPAVRCPACGAWHHQIRQGDPEHATRECWTYSERCAICPQPTELGAGYRWTPEVL